METCFNYVDKDRAFFSSDERRYINKVRNLQKKYPDKVRIIREPEDNDGCIYCELPVSWFKLYPKREMSDEQKELARVRMNQRIQDGAIAVNKSEK